MDNFDLKEWYIWPCEAYPGAFNMAADHFLARQFGKLLDRPILRFFTWVPYCISLGYHQKLEDVDQEKCRKMELDVVRRPTGGRAILHAEELTYSVIYPFYDLEVMQFYQLTHQPFVEALMELGVPAEFKPSQTDFKKFYKSDNASVCFATSAKYEVEINNRKLIGSAQRVYENAILQHGSLLLGPYHENLVDLLNLPDNKRHIMLDYIRQHTAYVRQFNEEIKADELAEKVEKAFSQLFNIQFVPIQQNSLLIDSLDELQLSKFETAVNQ